MTNEVNEQHVLVILLANDNHLSNVKTLQSIYNQDYPNIYLVACNDCTDHFQSERLFYNFEAGRPENIRGIYIHENKHPLGEYLMQKQFWDRASAQYVVTLHSGEYFAAPDALRKCVEQLEEKTASSALLVAAEKWSDDMKTRIKVFSPAAQGKTQQVSFREQVAIADSDFRDCMVLYRLDALQSQNFRIPTGCNMITPNILTALLGQKKQVTAVSQVLCKYSDESITDIKTPLTETYGNQRLQNLAELVRDRSSAPHAEKNKALFGAAPVIPAQTAQKNRWLTLYKYSRFSKLKSYAAIDLLMFICAAVLMITRQSVLMVAGGALMALAVLLLCWTATMLGYNLYFKKNPQRLVGE